MLRWLLQRGIVVIPKTMHKQRMEENIQVFDFALDAEDIQQIQTGRSTIYDEMDLQNAIAIGNMKFHD